MTARFVAIIAVACIAASSTDSEAGQLRSSSAKAQFQRLHHCPANDRPSGPCPGYVIDHIVPLVCGGADAPINMQWQGVAEAKEKDRWELSVYCPNRASSNNRQ